MSKKCAAADCNRYSEDSSFCNHHAIKNMMEMMGPLEKALNREAEAEAEAAAHERYLRENPPKCGNCGGSGQVIAFDGEVSGYKTCDTCDGSGNK